MTTEPILTLTQITFIRHGQVYNPEGIVYGRLPGFPLSELGKLQAQAAAEALRVMPPAAIFSSPLLRAQQTAEIVRAVQPEVPLYIAEELNEVHFFFEGQPLLAMAVRDWDFYSDVAPPYEQPADIIARVRRFLMRVRQDYAGQHVVAVTHGDVIAFTALWAFGAAPIPANKHTLKTYGLAEDYPALGSLLTLIYGPQADGERPTAVTYRRPYGEELADRGVSPK